MATEKDFKIKNGLILNNDTSGAKLTREGNYFRNTTQYGYIQLGPNNSGFAHIDTDRSTFYFSKKIQVDTGEISSYDEDLLLQRAGSTKLTLGTTTATFADDVIVTGNLYVTGTSTAVNVEDLNVEQGEITLNYGTGDTSASANGSGIRIQDAVNSTTDATITWSQTGNNFNVSHGWNSLGYLQHSGVLYSRNNLLVLNSAGTGWNTWATRSNGQFNLSVGTITATDLYLNDTNTRIHEGSGNIVKVTTSTGYLEIGSANAAHAHLQTDRASFYFNKRILVNEGVVSSYDEDLILRRAEASNTGQLVLGSGKFTGTEAGISSNLSTMIIGGMVGDAGYEQATGHFYIPGISPNAFSGLSRRGTVTITKNGTDLNGDYTNMFTSGGDFYAFSHAAGTTDTIVITLSDFGGLSYGQNYGIQFCHPTFRAKDIEIEVSTDGGTNWTSICDVTDYPHAVLHHYYSGGGTAVNTVRYTLTNFANTGMRINQVFGYDYSEPNQYYLEKYRDNLLYADSTWTDNYKAKFGTGGDLHIYHDGLNSYIDDAGTGNLRIRAGNLQLQRADGSQNYLAANTGAEVVLYYAGNPKLETTSVGIAVTGTQTISDTGTTSLTVGSTTVGGGNESITLGSYSSSESDITGLVSGSTFGGLIQGGTNGHLVVGIRDNDAADSFSVVSGSANYMTDTTYDKLAFQVRADGTTTINGYLTALGGSGGYWLHARQGNSSPGGALPALGILNNADPASATYGWAFYDSNTNGDFSFYRRNGSTTANRVYNIARADGTFTYDGLYMGFPTLDLAISNNNSSHGYSNYLRGGSSHLVIGTGGTLYLNYGNTSGSIYTYGTMYHQGDIRDVSDSQSIRLMHGTTSSQPSIGVGEQGVYGMKIRWDSGSSVEFDGFWNTSVTGTRNRDLGDINVNTATWNLPALQIAGADVATQSYSSNATNITSGTLNTARLPNPIQLSGVTAIIKLQETDVTNNPNWWHVADGGNYSIRLNNTGNYPFTIVTNGTNDAVSNIVLGYNTDFSAGIDVTGNITVTGTVDGVDIASRDAVLTSTTTTANNALPKSGGTMTGAINATNIYMPASHSKTKIGLYASNGAEWIGTSANTLELSGTNINLNGASGSGAPTLKHNTNTLVDTAQGVYANKLYIDGKLVLDMPSNSTERGPWNPIVTSIRNSGRRLHYDEEFADGYNSVGVYNNSGGGTVVHTRETASTTLGTTAPNNSQYVIKIYYNGGTASPGFGGFIQAIPSEDNHTFVQIFQALLPSGKNLVIAENAQGSNNTSYWLTDTAGTGKWEWYARVSHCGQSGTFSTGGHVYVTGGSGAFTWYLASCTVYDVTEAENYTKVNSSNQLEGLQITTGSVANSAAGYVGLVHDGNYTTGQYRHRWRKQDNGGGVPLYLDYSEGTANSYSTIARFGPYSGNAQEFEVYGQARIASDLEIGTYSTTASGNLYLNGTTANKRARLHCTNGNLHLDSDEGNGVYLQWYGGNAGTYFGDGSAAQVGRIDGSGNLTLSGSVTSSSGQSTFDDIVIDKNIASPANYYNDVQFEIRATSGTAGIGLHRNGYSHCGIYHDASNTLKFNMNGGTVTLNHDAGTLLGTGNYTSTLDGRYYTETESDSRFINASGDSTTGALTFTTGGFIMQRTSASNSIWWNSGSDQNHVLWNDYYGGPTTRGSAGSGSDGIKWNTYDLFQVRGGTSGAQTVFESYRASGSAGSGTYAFRAHYGNTPKFWTTTNGIAVNTNYVGNYGSASMSWAGSANYPTLYSDHSDRWVMICFPHIPYLANGVNSHTGGTTGSTIRFASDSSTTTYWDAGIGATGDLFRIGRAGINRLEINSSGYVNVVNALGINGTFNAAQGVLQVRGDQTMNRGSFIRWANDAGGTGEYIYSKSTSPYDVTIHSGSYDALQCPNTGQVIINYNGVDKITTQSEGAYVNGALYASASGTENTPYDTLHTHVIRNEGGVNGGNGGGTLFVNDRGNHSWGTVAEFRINTASDSDNPSIIFTSAAEGTNTWGIGYGYTDTSFRINRDHGHLNSNWGVAMMTLDRSGNATFAGNVTAYSDERLKENIKTIENAVDTVKQLRGVTYNWKEDGREGLGVIAQEVEKVDILKSLVTETPQDHHMEERGFATKNVAYGNMVGLLIEAIKEQQETIESLKNEISNLVKDINSLKGDN